MKVYIVSMIIACDSTHIIGVYADKDKAKRACRAEMLKFHGREQTKRDVEWGTSFHVDEYKVQHRPPCKCDVI